MPIPRESEPISHLKWQTSLIVPLTKPQPTLPTQLHSTMVKINSVSRDGTPCHSLSWCPQAHPRAHHMPTELCCERDHSHNPVTKSANLTVRAMTVTLATEKGKFSLGLSQTIQTQHCRAEHHNTTSNPKSWLLVSCLNHSSAVPASLWSTSS